MTRRFFLSLAATIFFSQSFLLTGCATIHAQAKIGNDYQFQMESIGSKAQLYTSCLTPDTIKVLFPGSSKPPSAVEASCYQVFLISSSNSAINSSMDEFLSAKQEFDGMLNEIVKAKSPQEASKNASAVQTAISKPTDGNTSNKDALSAIVSDAIAKKPEEVQSRTEAVGKQLTETQKVELIDGLKEIKDETPINKVKDNVDAAIETLQSK